LFLLSIYRLLRSTLFPYTTLFRSCDRAAPDRGRPRGLLRGPHRARRDVPRAQSVLRVDGRRGRDADGGGRPRSRSCGVAARLHPPLARNAHGGREACGNRDAMESRARGSPPRQARGPSRAEDRRLAVRLARRLDQNPQSDSRRIRAQLGTRDQSSTKNCFLNLTVNRLASLIGVTSTVKIKVSPSEIPVSPT